MKSNIEFRDIHLPQGVDIFPLGYGWYFLITSIVFVYVIYKLVIWILKTSKKHYALGNLKNIDVNLPIVAVVQMSELLRRICNVKYKEASVLFGEDWLDFLRKHTKCKLSDNAGKLLLFAPFMDKNSKEYTSTDALEVKKFCKEWIGENL
ncbi:MAG: DUF4381 domain-containing protein [Alphaproteobacteria bacterium]|nr:DUF4381 domain-containing protein [Alphaproteobacteria bacterium]